MDPSGTISQRVYRDGTRYIDGKYVKDLSALNRPLHQTLIIDDNADCISMQVCVPKDLSLLGDPLPPRILLVASTLLLVPWDALQAGRLPISPIRLSVCAMPGKVCKAISYPPVHLPAASIPFFLRKIRKVTQPLSSPPPSPHSTPPYTNPPPMSPIQPENAIKVKAFSLEDGSDPTADTVLYDLAPFLRALATQVSLCAYCYVCPCGLIVFLVLVLG